MQPIQLPSNDALRANFEVETHPQNHQLVSESAAKRATKGMRDAAETLVERRVSFHEAIYHWIVARR